MQPCSAGVAASHPYLSWEAEARTLRCRSVSGQAELLGFPLARWREEGGFLPRTLFARDRDRFLDSCRAATEGRPSIGRYRVRTASGALLPFRLALDGLRWKDTALLRGQMLGVEPEEERSPCCLEPGRARCLGRIITRFDRRLRHLYVSPAIQQLVGLPPTAFLGRTNEELGMPPRLVRLWNEQLLRLLRRGEPGELEFRLLVGGAPGKVRSVSFHSRLLPEFDERGEVCSLLTVAEVHPAVPPSSRRSASSRQESQAPAPAAEPVRSPPIKRRAHALTQEERLAWLERVAETLAARVSKQQLLQSIEELAFPLLGDQGGVDLLREQGLERMVRFPAVASVEPDPWSRPFPFVTRVLHAGRAQLLYGPPELVLQALAQDAEHLRQLQAEGLQSFLAVPLLRGGEAYGCLWFASTDGSGPLGAEELVLAQHLALLLSPSVEAARLRRIEQELRRREALLEEKTEALRRVASVLGEALLPAQVANAVMGEVKRALAARAAVVYQADASGTSVELLRFSGYDATVTRQYERIPLEMHSPITSAVKQRQGIWVESGEAFRRDYPALAARFPEREDGSWVALPLLIEGRVLGVLAFSFDHAHVFTPEERSFALALAQLCSPALERVRLYKQQHAQIEELQTLLDVLPVGIAIARDRECLHVTQNPALARMLGISPEQNVSLSAPEEERVPGLRIFHRGRELEARELPLQKAAASGRPVLDLELDAMVQGQPRATALSFAAPLFDKEGHPRGAVAAFLDITERKRTAEAQRFLAQSSAALSASLEPEWMFQKVTRLCIPMLGSLALLYTCNPDGTLRLRACAHEERGSEQLILELGRGGRLLAEPLVRRCLESGQPLLSLQAAEARGAKDEELTALWERLALGTLVVIPLMSRGRPASALVCGSRQGGAEPDFRLTQDFAERAALALDNARLYQESREATALREQFLAVAGHELKTPLTALRLGLENLTRRGPKEGPEKVARWIEQCQKQGERLGRLIDDLLDVSRLTTGRLPLRLEQLELSALVEDNLLRMAPQFEKAGCAVTSSLDDPVPGWWDRTRLDQVLTNLFTNALKYGPGLPIEVSVFSTPEHAVIRVRDHGIGIAPEDQARIFQRFERAVSERHYGGLGLGLWISRELVALMGGWIEVQSAPGQGATFTVYLPREGAGSAAGVEVRMIRERPER